MLENELETYKRCAEEAIDDDNRLKGDALTWRMRLMASVVQLEDALEKEVSEYMALPTPDYGKMTDFKEDPFTFEQSLRCWIAENRDRGCPPLYWDYFVENGADAPSHAVFKWEGISSCEKYIVIFGEPEGSAVLSDVFDPDLNDMTVAKDEELTGMYQDAEEWLRTEKMTRQLIKDMFPVEDAPEF